MLHVAAQPLRPLAPAMLAAEEAARLNHLVATLIAYSLTLSTGATCTWMGLGAASSATGKNLDGRAGTGPSGKGFSFGAGVGLAGGEGAAPAHMLLPPLDPPVHRLCSFQVGLATKLRAPIITQVT